MKSSLLGMNWKIPDHSAFFSENTRIVIMRCGCKEFRKRVLDFMRFRGFPQVSANEKIVFPIFHSRNEKKCGKRGRWWLKQRFSFHERKKKLNKDVAGAGQWKNRNHGKAEWTGIGNIGDCSRGGERRYGGNDEENHADARRMRRAAGTDWNGLGA